MTKNKSSADSWTLLKVPRWKVVALCVFCFSILWLNARPAGFRDYLVCIGSSIGYIVLFDVYRMFLYPAALRFLHWSLFIVIAFGYAMGSGLASRAICGSWGVDRANTHSVSFAFVVAAAGALGATIGRVMKGNARHPKHPTEPTVASATSAAGHPPGQT